MRLPDWLGPAAVALALVCAALWFKERIESAEARGQADALATENVIVTAERDSARARADSLAAVSRRDSVVLDSVATAEQRSRRVADIALDSLDMVKAELHERVRPTLPPRALPAYDSLIATHAETVDTLRSQLRAADQLQATTYAALLSVRAERDALLEDRAESSQVERLLRAEVGALRDAGGSPGWLEVLKLAGCAGGGALVGSWVAEERGAAAGAALGVVGCRVL